MYRRLPTDPFITDMDPVLKLWLYENWLGDHRDDAELAKNHAYLLGSFWNPEAVRQMMTDVVHESSDEDMEESMRMVMETDANALEQAPIKRRRRKFAVKQE